MALYLLSSSLELPLAIFYRDVHTIIPSIPPLHTSFIEVENGHFQGEFVVDQHYVFGEALSVIDFSATYRKQPTRKAFDTRIVLINPFWGIKLERVHDVVDLEDNHAPYQTYSWMDLFIKESFFYQNSFLPILDRELWEAVTSGLLRRKVFTKEAISGL